LQIAFAFAVTLGASSIVLAQTYPSRPVTIIVPVPAGGLSDTLARILSERMRTSLGQPVVIENVTGAGGSIGVARVTRALKATLGARETLKASPCTSRRNS
jgi:tripartite-type tricarboxylate transporter receptor subunit TctC